MISTLYVLVKHGESEFRLYRRDGTDTGHTWSDCPDKGQVHSVGVPEGCYCFRLAEEVEGFN